LSFSLIWKEVTEDRVDHSVTTLLLGSIRQGH
jgi:hypothetical protein